MFGFPKEWLDELLSRADIVSVVSRYVHLQKKGNKFWGCCPFHNEKTPSFCVDDEKRFFHCFGCKAGGDAIKFIQQIESVPFMKAVEILANSVGMKVPDLGGDEEFVKKAKKKERLQKILEETNNFYVQSLNQPCGEAARRYVQSRGLTTQDEQNFSFGYSPNWTGLVNLLKKKGFSQAEMKEAGVCEIKNDHAYDVMCERLTFPIFDSFGSCVGFSARSLEQKPTYAKYKNTAETQIFNKSKTIYALNLVKKQKNTVGIDCVVLVEGQMDVIAMHSAGFQNTAACMGTAFTPLHAKELLRFSGKIVLFFDGDEAGKKAAHRAIPILQDAGCEVWVVSKFPENAKDPDEILKIFGKKKIESMLASALPATEFLFTSLAQEHDLTKPNEKAIFVSKANKMISMLPSVGMQEIYMDFVHKKTGISLNSIKTDVLNTKTFEKKQEPRKIISTVSKSIVEDAINFVLAAYVAKAKFASLPKGIEKAICNHEQKRIFKFLVDCKNPNMGLIYGLFEEESKTAKEIASNLLQAEKEEKYFNDSMWRIFENILKNEQQQLIDEAKVVQDPQEKREIMLKINSIIKKLMTKNWRICSE